MGDADQKANIFNYLENGNDAVFIDLLGEGDFNTSVIPANDVMFCINNVPAGADLTVDPC